MAKKKIGITPAITDRSLWYSDIAFMPPEDKNELWMAQFLFYAKLNSVRFLDTKKCHEYRKLERLEIDQQTYINLIDPKDVLGGGGEAKYFAADFKANPIDVHLDNIVRAKLDKICLENQLQISEIDKFAKSQKQRDKDRIIYQREFRKIINDVHEQLNIPPIKDSQTPYNYVKSLNKENADKMMDSVDTLLDYIKSQIKDSQDLTLYETYVYKGDIERAFELGIEHYLMNMNKWRNWAEFFNNDIKNFNRACGTWYTDETSGRGLISYIEPDRLFTNPFKTKTGEDVVHWFYEEDITFADFIRRFGTTLTDVQLKEVFDLNKLNGNHTLSWNSAMTSKGSQSKIRIGRLSCLTQDAEKFAEQFVNNKVSTFENKPLTWMPTEKDSASIKQKIYNVVYSCYYIPPPATRLDSNIFADWHWQSKYIFDMHKDYDMYRMGVDGRYTKSGLVLYRDERPSFVDVKQAFMPKIHTTWHKYQNCLVQDTTALLMSKTLISGLLKAVDEGNKITPGDPDRPTGGNGLDPTLESIKSMKQGGLSFFNFTDKNGEIVTNPGEQLLIYVDSKHLDKAERLLKLIMETYSMMIVALSQNDLTEGQNPIPRTNELSVQASLTSAQNGIWFMEKPCREIQIMFGERVVQWMLSVIKERKKYGAVRRFEEMQNVIGMGNALMLEGIEDLNPEEIGITVDLEDVKALKEFYTTLATGMLKEGKVMQEDIELVISAIQKNYKYGACLLSIAAKKMQKERADMEDLAYQRQSQLLDKQLQIQAQMQQLKDQGQVAQINAQGSVDAKLIQIENQLKALNMQAQKEQLLQNKLTEQDNKSEKAKEEKLQEPFALTENAA